MIAATENRNCFWRSGGLPLKQLMQDSSGAFNRCRPFRLCVSGEHARKMRSRAITVQLNQTTTTEFVLPKSFETTSFAWGSLNHCAPSITKRYSYRPGGSQTVVFQPPLGSLLSGVRLRSQPLKLPATAADFAPGKFRKKSTGLVGGWSAERVVKVRGGTTEGERACLGCIIVSFLKPLSYDWQTTVACQPDRLNRFGVARAWKEMGCAPLPSLQTSAGLGYWC